MGNEVVRFINFWLYDVDRFLRSRLEYLKDDLLSEDPKTQRKTTKEVAKILDWLNPPLPPLTATERLEKALSVSQQDGLSANDKETAVARAMRSTGRHRGRPRDTTSQLAIRAFGLHFALGMSWREIAFRLKGCSHVRPRPPHQRPRKRNPNISCEDCGDAVRIAVLRLKKFLATHGFEADVPTITNLDDESRSELLRLWGLESSDLPRT